MKNRSNTTIITALALTLGLTGFAVAANEPFADVNNNGQFDGGDVALGAQLADGIFSTDVAEPGWTPKSGKVGIVVPRELTGRNSALVLVASGDITVLANVTASGPSSVLLVLSQGGGVTVGNNVRMQGNTAVQIAALNDVVLGDEVALRTRDSEFSVVSVASQTGDVIVGKDAAFSSAGQVEIVTNNTVGGAVVVGPRARIGSSSGMARVTAGGEVTLNNAQVTGRSVIIGSHSSSGDGRRGTAGAGSSPGYASVTNSALRSGRRGSVLVFADGGEGSMIDFTGSTPTTSSLTLEADVVLQ